MELKAIKCPLCGAEIDDLEFGSKVIYCKTCGKPIFDVDNDNSTVNFNYTYRKVDETKSEAINADYKFKSKELEYKERSDGLLRKLIVFALIMVVVIILICLVYERKLTAEKKEQIEKNEAAGMIVVGTSSRDFIGEKYSWVESTLQGAGFENIELVDLHDSFPLSKKANTVESVSIAGDSSFSEDDFFYPDDKIVISYH